MEQLNNLSEEQRKMEKSLLAALDWAMGIEDEDEQVEVIGEICSYAAIEGDYTDEQIDELFNKAN